MTIEINDADVQEHFEDLTQDIDFDAAPPWSRMQCFEMAAALWVFEWPQREAGGEIFDLDQLEDGTIVLCYKAWERDNDDPEDDRLKQFVFITALTGEPAEVQILNAIVNCTEHEIREQLTFNGEHTLFPTEEHGRRTMKDGTVYNDRGGE